MVGNSYKFTGWLSAALLVSFLGLSPPAQAQGWGNQDSQIRQIRPLQFGQITRPSLGTNTYTLHWQNNDVDTGGGGDGFYLGDASSGFYQVRGQPNQAVTITGHINNFGVDGVTVEEVHINGPSNGYVTTLNGGGIAMLRVGGVVSVSAAAMVGLHYTEIYLNLNYE